MKIVDNTMYTAPIPMMVDMNKVIAINGQIFTKDLTPVPLKFLKQLEGQYVDTDSYMACPISCKEVIKKNPHNNHESQKWFACSNQKKLSAIVDSEDENIVYSVLHGVREDTYPPLYKFKVNEDLSVDTLVFNPSDCHSRHIVGQSKDYIYMIGINKTNGYYWYHEDHIRTYIIKKSDFSVKQNKYTIVATAADQSSYYTFVTFPQFTKLYENDNYIYIHVSGNEFLNTHVIFVFDKKENNAKQIYSYKQLPSSGVTPQNEQRGVMTQATTGFFDEATTTLSYFITESVDNSSQEDGIDSIIEFYRVDIQETDLTVTVTKLDAKIELTYHYYKKYYRFHVYRPVVTYTNDDIFLSYVPCNRCGYEDYQENDKSIFTFKVNKIDMTLEYIGATKCNNAKIYIDFFEKNQGNNIIVVTEFNIEFYTFNKDTNLFESQHIIPTSMREVGIDLQGRLWIRDISNNLEMLNESLPSTVKVSFDKDEYAYQGYSINSHINISATNFNGESIEVDIEVILRGECSFEDGTKTKKVKTSADGVYTLPIVINGSGPLKVSARLVE